MAKQPMLGKGGWLAAGKRACKKGDCRAIKRQRKPVSGFSRQWKVVEIWRCSNCRRTFEGKDAAWRHLWSIL